MVTLRIGGHAVSLLVLLSLVVIWVHLPPQDRAQMLDAVKLTAELIVKR